MLVRHPCCDDCAQASGLGAASLFAIDNPAQQLPQPVPTPDDNRQVFDDLMSVASLLSIVINLTR